MRIGRLIAAAAAIWVGSLAAVWPTQGPSGSAVVYAQGDDGSLNAKLAAVLKQAGFTGDIESTIPYQLGRPLDLDLVKVGKLLFFDNILGLHEDNSCAGCHSPAFSFGDSQSMAIGVDSNLKVGADRTGPRNQRKAPPVTNSAFFRRLMLNGRFEAKSGNPFDNSRGFKFPPPEGDAVMFRKGDDRFPTLLSAQGHIPQTELVEMAGFTGAGTNPTIDPKFDVFFDDGHGTPLPNDKDHNGFLNEEIRAAVLGKINATDGYVSRFARIFGDGDTRRFKVTFDMVGKALSEFQISLTTANAPIDRFAQGEPQAMTDDQKRGALLFFGKAKCVQCHAVKGQSFEMFSDFENYVLGVPQIAPQGFGPGGNVMFDSPDGPNPNGNEDFGAEQISGNAADRYKFRASPLRNVALQPAFFHNGAFTKLEDAIRHHLDVKSSARSYNPATVRPRLDPDLMVRMGPIEPVLERLDRLVQEPTSLSGREFNDLLAFVRDGLLDPRAKPRNMCRLEPSVPSGMPVLLFQGC